MSTPQQAILEKKEALASQITEPMLNLSRQCALVWGEVEQLDEILSEAFKEIPHCTAMYAWNVTGRQVSSLHLIDGRDLSWRGKDLSSRPYLKNNLPFKGIMLSSVYQNIHTDDQSVTALHSVRRHGELLGFIAADFGLAELLLDASVTLGNMQWQQFKGDPAVRGTLFLQERAQSRMDENIDQVLENFYRLFKEHGVFHSKIHFSSGRCSFWLFEDPYNYRIHGVDEVIDPDLCLYYPMAEYPKKAKVAPIQIRQAFENMKALRFADETIYLRSSSINIMNGMVGLTFSCDGSHYMPVQEFIDKNTDFWFGVSTSK